MILRTHQFLLSGVHRHHNPLLSEAENNVLFHKCSRYHGHEYKVEFILAASVPWHQSVSVVEVIKQQIIDPLYGKNLNDHFGNTSGEIIAEQLLRQCRTLVGDRVERIRVVETRKNSFSVATPTGTVGD